MKQIKLKVITPKEIVADEASVLSVSIPARMGRIEVLPNHARLVTALSAGSVIYKIGTTKRTLNITGGLFRIFNNEATLLADATLATVTSLADARAARETSQSTR